MEFPTLIGSDTNLKGMVMYHSYEFPMLIDSDTNLKGTVMYLSCGISYADGFRYQLDGFLFWMLIGG